MSQVMIFKRHMHHFRSLIIYQASDIKTTPLYHKVLLSLSRW